MNLIFLTGIVGSLVLVIGAASKEGDPQQPPYRSLKNWLLGTGGLIMWLYALLNYFYQGGPVFFVFLESLVIVATVLMMVDSSDVLDGIVLSLVGGGFIVWSLMLFQGVSTVFFILGLTGIGLGYAYQGGTLRRAVALTAGSALVALFSYLSGSWIFFWLNVFFALLSGWYLWLALRATSQSSPSHSPAQPHQ